MVGFPKSSHISGLPSDTSSEFDSASMFMLSTDQSDAEVLDNIALLATMELIEAENKVQKSMQVNTSNNSCLEQVPNNYKLFHFYISFA